jgi:hypothetical protein
MKNSRRKILHGKLPELQSPEWLFLNELFDSMANSMRELRFA